MWPARNEQFPKKRPFANRSKMKVELVNTTIRGDRRKTGRPGFNERELTRKTVYHVETFIDIFQINRYHYTDAGDLMAFRDIFI